MLDHVYLLHQKSLRLVETGSTAIDFEYGREGDAVADARLRKIDYTPTAADGAALK